MLSRRQLLKGFTAFGAGGAGFGGYAVAEPWRLEVTRYRIAPPGWPAGLSLRLAVLADLHVCDPWMGLARVETIVARTNALAADAVLLLGDYIPGDGMSRVSEPVPLAAWTKVLAGLDAPLGTHAVLGNHDWWDDADAQARRQGPTRVGRALEAAGIPVYDNASCRLAKNGQPFWLAGLGSQWALYPRSGSRRRTLRIPYEGVDDLDGTLAAIGDDAPIVLMAHEPDIFAHVPDRVALTLSGHTHGGQVQVMGYAPIIPSRYGRRYAYGHIEEGQRSLVVSGGLGCSGVPVRFGRPPEIVVVEIESMTA